MIYDFRMDKRLSCKEPLHIAALTFTVGRRRLSSCDPRRAASALFWFETRMDRCRNCKKLLHLNDERKVLLSDLADPILCESAASQQCIVVSSLSLCFYSRCTDFYAWSPMDKSKEGGVPKLLKQLDSATAPKSRSTGQSTLVEHRLVNTPSELFPNET